MGGQMKHKVQYFGTMIVCCTGLALPAFAAPPFGKHSNAELRPAPESRAVEPRGFAPRAIEPRATAEFRSASPIPHLDLRAPSGMAALAPAYDHSASLDRFSIHRHSDESSDESTLPSLGAGAGHPRIMSGAEALARRLHREGLPLARLWENHSALVSLGLNQRGKPGLWLVQKTR